MHALKQKTNDLKILKSTLYQLVLNTSCNMRSQNLSANGIRVSLIFSDNTLWQKSHKTKQKLFDTYDIFLESLSLLNQCPQIKIVKILPFLALV